jgi:hypothetical protein
VLPLPASSDCDCDPLGTVPEICSKSSGKCICKEGFGGPRCDRCEPGWFDYPNCQSCNCSGVGADSSICDPQSGQCPCYNNFGARKCAQCSSGFYSYPDCLGKLYTTTRRRSPRHQGNPLSFNINYFQLVGVILLGPRESPAMTVANVLVNQILLQPSVTPVPQRDTTTHCARSVTAILMVSRTTLRQREAVMESLKVPCVRARKMLRDEFATLVAPYFGICNNGNLLVVQIVNATGQEPLEHLEYVTSWMDSVRARQMSTPGYARNALTAFSTSVPTMVSGAHIVSAMSVGLTLLQANWLFVTRRMVSVPVDQVSKVESVMRSKTPSTSPPCISSSTRLRMETERT